MARDGEETPEDGPQDLLGILTAMGFAEKDARRALQQNPTVPAAVAAIMSFGGKIQPAAGAAASNFYDAAIQPAAAGLFRAASGLMEAMGEFGEQVQAWAQTPAGDAEDASANKVQAAGEETETLRLPASTRTATTLPFTGDVQAAAHASGKGPRAAEPAKEVPRVAKARACDVELALVTIGFSREQAQAAARRCSSTEAAVEWLAANPDIEH